MSKISLYDSCYRPEYTGKTIERILLGPTGVIVEFVDNTYLIITPNEVDGINWGLEIEEGEDN